MHLRPGLCPVPHWGSLRRSSDPLVGWAGNSPPRIPPNSSRAPRPLQLRRLGLPPTHNFWLRHCAVSVLGTSPGTCLPVYTCDSCCLVGLYGCFRHVQQQAQRRWLLWQQNAVRCCHSSEDRTNVSPLAFRIPQQIHRSVAGPRALFVSIDLLAAYRAMHETFQEARHRCNELRTNDDSARCLQ